MANLSITTECNRSCEFCFARSAGTSTKTRHMSMETYELALDFLERSEISTVRLLGGEPTMHPTFPEFAVRALKRNFNLLVFTNGLMPERAISCMEEVPADQVSLLINALMDEEPSSAQIKRQDDVLRRLGHRLGPRITLSVNIGNRGLDSDRLLARLAKNHLRQIRVGLAHPDLGGSNSWLRPRYYDAAGRALTDLIAKCSRNYVSIEFDCGFVPCMFPSDVLDSINAQDVGRRCSPILDILADGQVISCYPLAALGKIPLDCQVDANFLRQSFTAGFSSYRAAGVFTRCSSCDLKQNGDCLGGCLAVSLKRNHPQSASLVVSFPLPGRSKQPQRQQWSIPYIDQPIGFWHSLRDEFEAEISEIYLPLPFTLIGSGRPPQPSRYTLDLLDHSPFPINVVVNPIVILQSVERVAPQIVAFLRDWHERYGIASVTVANIHLAECIREQLSHLRLVASTLMEIYDTCQIPQITDLFDVLVPSTRIIRNLPLLQAMRHAFAGRLRLIVNEGCLPGCMQRTQHFHEMAAGTGYLRSLCEPLLERSPWLRLTGAWILPQHLHLFNNINDEWKLAGRVTLREPHQYKKVLRAYINRSELGPHEIGGGPASVDWPVQVPESFYSYTLTCGHNCGVCGVCREFAEETRGD